MPYVIYNTKTKEYFKNGYAIWDKNINKAKIYKTLTTAKTQLKYRYGTKYDIEYNMGIPVGTIPISIPIPKEYVIKEVSISIIWELSIW